MYDSGMHAMITMKHHVLGAFAFEALRSRPYFIHQQWLFFERTLHVLTPTFRLPSTLSGVLFLNGVIPPSFFTSAWQLAWYTLLPILMASIHTKSCASSFHTVSNFSWQMGHGSLVKAGSDGTGICLFLGSAAAKEAAKAALVAEEGASVMRTSSGSSRDLIHSCAVVNIGSLGPSLKTDTYQFVNVPTPALTTLSRVHKTLICPEMPV